MKYLKTYEEQIELNVGDYVILKHEEFGVGKIMDIYDLDDDDETVYKIELNIGTQKVTMSFLYYHINNKLTEQEIKDYIIVQNANKYNL